MTRADTDRIAIALFEQLLEQPEAARDAWLAAQTAGRPELHARVEAMRAADRLARLRTGGAVDEIAETPPPERIGAYLIRERIGRGGMGSVYRAERATGDFRHIVAIKIIKPGLLSDALVERFQRERATLAQLVHPNIAQLYDGGEAAGGSPYIVMEYVDGLPLLDYAAEKGLDRAGRRRLFLAICDAVSAAHRSLIVHRDLTPSNVLVTRDGVVKLIDFGIAKPAEDEAGGGGVSGPGHTASLSLTPGYAAPERMTGAPVTTATDIYSLGKLLEKLIPPDTGDRDLNAIIACATAADPAQRYPTADALANDVVAWAAGEPVAAVRGGRGYRAGKFVRRNRGALAATALMFVLLVGALIATLVANRKTEAALRQAETRFAETRSLARVMMFDVYDTVSALPGSTDARFLLARTAQDYLDSLAADKTAPVDVRLDVGEGYFRLARVVGYTGGGSLGRREEGKKLFDQAEQVLTALHTAAPQRADVRLALGHLLSVRAGEWLYGESDAKAARRDARKARSLLESLSKLDARGAGALAGAYLYEGDSWGWDNDISAAGRVYESGIARVTAMPPALRNSEEVRMSMSGLLRQSGAVYRENRETDRAIARLGEAVAVSRELVAADPDNPATQRKLLTTLWALADMYRAAGQYDRALTAIRESHAIARAGAQKSGSDTGPREAIALTGLVLAQVQSALGDHGPAVAAASEAIVIRRDMASRGGDNKGARITLAVGLKDAAPIFRAAGDRTRSCSALREARAILTQYERDGSLSDYDRTNNLAPVSDALTAC